jgi:hypothetical protein
MNPVQKLVLLRLESRDNLPQRGVILVDGSPKWATLELPWRDNAKHVSCIPEGTYLCKKSLKRMLHTGKQLPVTFEVEGVPGRDGILFHTGNRASDTKGCILLGQGYSDFKGEQWIINSRIAFETFVEYTENINEFSLEIRKYG